MYFRLQVFKLDVSGPKCWQAHLLDLSLLVNVTMMAVRSGSKPLAPPDSSRRASRVWTRTWSRTLSRITSAALSMSLRRQGVRLKDVGVKLEAARAALPLSMTRAARSLSLRALRTSSWQSESHSRVQKQGAVGKDGRSLSTSRMARTPAARATLNIVRRRDTDCPRA